MEKTAAALGRLKSLWQTPEKRVKFILALGISGIILIFLSQFWPGKEEKTAEALPQASVSAYGEELEQQLSTLIRQISGAGETRVMVTLANDGETLYVRETRTDRDYTKGGTDDPVTERESREEEYVLIDGKEGRTALVRTRMEPVIKGVVVVCEGGDDPVTVMRILEAVTTALAISSAKVCITKLA